MFDTDVSGDLDWIGAGFRNLTRMCASGALDDGAVKQAARLLGHHEVHANRSRAGGFASQRAFIHIGRGTFKGEAELLQQGFAIARS